MLWVGTIKEKQIGLSKAQKCEVALSSESQQSESSHLVKYLEGSEQLNYLCNLVG